jgi:uncharacterized protein (DUF2236 family)
MGRDAGLFGPDSVTWRVNREGALLLGGGRALILQVAHPLVAAGVADHSNYREDPWGRLYRTLDVTTRVIFGSTDTAEEAAERLWNVHGRVRGVTTESGGRYPKGTPYDAREPDLLTWVWATLVDTSLLVYSRYVGSLTVVERNAYYDEQKLLAEKFGIPPGHVPETYGDFNHYFDEMLAGDRIAVTDALRDVVDATVRPELPFVAKPLVEALNLATVGMLPAGLRTDLGLPWGPNRERLFAASRTLGRTLIPVLPGLVREFPPARTAGRRLQAA